MKIKNLIKNVLMLGLVVTIFGNKKVNIAKDVAPHVVSYNILTMDNDRYATGFHVEYNGGVYILTNKHVCDLQRRTYQHDHIQFEDYVGEIIAVDDIHDLCLVTSNREEGLSLASSPIKVLEEVTVVGFPRGLPKTIRKGHVIQYGEIHAPWVDELNKVETFSISSISYGGNSGSPVVNEDGEVVGVLFAGPVMYITEAEIVPLDYVKMFLESHVGE